MKRVLAVLAVLAASPAAAQDRQLLQSQYGAAPGIILYDGAEYSGEQRDFPAAVPDLNTYRFNDRAMSAVIDGRSWELCEHANFQGRCVRIDRDAPNLGAIGLSRRVSSARPVSAAPPTDGLRLFSETDLRGRPYRINEAEPDLSPDGFNDAARSLVADGRWQVCSNANFGGRCQIVEGAVPDLRTLGLAGSISSARPAAPQPGEVQSLRGRTAMFFATTDEPACANARGGDECRQQAADAFCRRQGFRESNYFSVDRRQRGTPRLGDVLCVR